MSGQKGMALLEKILKNMKCSPGFDKTLRKINIISAGDGKCCAEFTVAQEHENVGGHLHGGFTATLVDAISTYALVTKKGVRGVSVNMSINYLKAARDGEEVVVDANTVRAGKNVAFLEVTLTNKKTGDIIAIGSHTKFMVG